MRNCSGWWIAIGLALAAASGCGEARPPNLLLISIDSLRADHLGAYGYERDTSPTLDRLAAQGVLFETMVAETSWTLPSHLTMLTGLSSVVHGVTDGDRSLPDGAVTLAEVLRAHGYRTEAFTSAPYLHPIFGFRQGFDDYEVIGTSVYDAPGATLERVIDEQEWMHEKWRTDALFQLARSADVVAERVEEAVARLGDDPFFLFVHVFDVHYDYDPPEQYWRLFDPDYAGDLDTRGFVFAEHIHAGMAPEDLAHLLARYDGEIRWVDDQLARMLAALERSGVADDTLVVVTSDHGDEFFEHGGKGHRKTLYDEQLLVPFVLRLPGRLPAGVRVSAQGGMVDIFPTLLDVLDLPSPPTSGRSLRPAIEAPERAPSVPVLSLLRDVGETTVTLRADESKLEARLVAEPRDTGDVEWARHFDLRTDPGEQRPAADGADALLGELARVRAEEAGLRERLGLGAAAPVVVPEALERQLEALGYAE